AVRSHPPLEGEGRLRVARAGSGDLSTRALFGAEGPSPHPVSHFRCAQCEPTLPLQGRVSAASIEQTWRVVDGCAFDPEHLQLRDHAAIGGEAAGLVAGREHAMAGHHDRARVAAERLADIT